MRGHSPPATFLTDRRRVYDPALSDRNLLPIGLRLTEEPLYGMNPRDVMLKRAEERLRSSIGMTSKAVLAFGAALLLASITQLPLTPKYLSLDNVNFAFALEQFDPWAHQPHPPGYPFF